VHCVNEVYSPVNKEQGSQWLGVIKCRLRISMILEFLLTVSQSCLELAVFNDGFG
jgi:hypothetical protein